jgi:hypothetical protein
MDRTLQIKTGRILEYPASLALGCKKDRISNTIIVEWGAISAEYDRLYHLPLIDPKWPVLAPYVALIGAVICG